MLTALTNKPLPAHPPPPPLPRSLNDRFLNSTPYATYFEGRYRANGCFDEHSSTAPTWPTQRHVQHCSKPRPIAGSRRLCNNVCLLDISLRPGSSFRRLPPSVLRVCSGRGWRDLPVLLPANVRVFGPARRPGRYTGRRLWGPSR